jgi:hypothetical protein
MSTSRPGPSRAELQRSLARVHAELAATPQVDERSRQLLREVLADIERLLDQQPASVAADESPDSAPQRLEGLAVQFEAGHPVLAASVRQFIDLLGRAGL